jgi:hypothetical protein
MKRAMVVLLATMSLGGCAVYPASPYDYRAPVPAVTVYQQPYVYRHYDNGYARQQQWQRWYDCQRYYGNHARCAY